MRPVTHPTVQPPIPRCPPFRLLLRSYQSKLDGMTLGQLLSEARRLTAQKKQGNRDPKAAWLVAQKLELVRAEVRSRIGRREIKPMPRPPPVS